ncbi:MAG: glycosyltransferase, partial [Candidatus Caldatribacteriaceae bacterium]
ALFLKFLQLRPLCIHAYDFDTVIPALLVRPLIWCKVIYDISDWYSESRRVGQLKALVDKIERWACKKADFVIIAHEKRLVQLAFEPKKWVAIHNVPKDIRDKIVSQKPPIQGDYFAYVGVLHPDRGLDQIVQATSISKTRAIIAGFGPLENYCREISEREAYIHFLGKTSYEETLQIEGHALAILALYDPSLRNNQLAAPNKLYEAMMLGRPLVTNRGTLVSQLVEEEKIGVTFTYGDVEGLASAMRWLKEHPEEREEMGHRARRVYEERYSFERQREKLLRAYEEVLKL